MIYFTSEESQVLAELGDRLRIRRIDRGDDQANFAARVGVSIPTYRKMEKGDGSVPIGYWVRAVRLLGRIDQIEDLLPVPLLSDARGRQRARRRPRVIDRPGQGGGPKSQ